VKNNLLIVLVLALAFANAGRIGTIGVLPAVAPPITQVQT
jgi:hypothetical protein